MNHLKLTFNMGELGKASFSPYEAQNMYTYYKGKYYAGGVGAIITVLGNEDLKWEKTRSLDANLEVGFLNDRISARFSYYNKLTNGLLADITLPQSNGFSYFKDNVGELENSGYELSLRGFPFRSDKLTVSLFGSLAHNKNVIKKISNSLKARNEKVDYDQDHYEPEYGQSYETAKPQAQYKEGESTTTIYAVRSLGINPMNGKEVYVDRYGNTTYTWSAADKVACGDTEPTMMGSFGANADWHGFNLNMSFLYQYGGQIYNQTLVDRVENADLRYNVDRRVLTERWQKPGDIAAFKDIKDRTRTNLTSRMIQDNDILQFKSLSLSYTFPKNITQRMMMERLKLTFQVEDLFYWSSVKRERGLDYPYSHSFNFGLQVQF
jgi:outer membrane receptor protein involved in Fe transport